MTRSRKVLQITIIVFAAAYYAWTEFAPRVLPGAGEALDNSAISAAIANRRSDVQVSGSGEVIKVLPDDNRGSRHQRFLVKLPSGDVILVAHNIDLAPRIPGLARGDAIGFYGEFEWNSKGGVVHWTHKDPANRHAHGWLRHDGRKYW
jgi:hypothetical protein